MIFRFLEGGESGDYMNEQSFASGGKCHGQSDRPCAVCHHLLVPILLILTFKNKLVSFHPRRRKCQMDLDRTILRPALRFFLLSNIINNSASDSDRSSISKITIYDYKLIMSNNSRATDVYLRSSSLTSQESSSSALLICG